MRTIKLTKEERAIEQSLEEYVPVRGREYEEIVAAIEQRKKTQSSISGSTGMTWKVSSKGEKIKDKIPDLHLGDPSQSSSSVREFKA